MKRCPQCEFIYEDDQSLCDMDGALLVFDSHTLPNLHALAPVTRPVPVKANRRIRAVPAFATLILVVVLGLVYYVSTRNAAVNTYLPSSAASTSDPSSVPATTDKPSEAQPPAPEPTPSPKEALQPAAKPSVTPAKKTTAKPTASRAEAKKDDSKVSSILKKTGRILKKPFKF
jgi:hypothetical protein